MQRLKTVDASQCRGCLRFFFLAHWYPHGLLVGVTEARRLRALDFLGDWTVCGAYRADVGIALMGAGVGFHGHLFSMVEKVPVFLS